MYLTDKLLKDDIISSKEVDVVTFGLENIATNLLGLLITLFIGSCFGDIKGSFILWIFVLPLRKNAGGFHARTPKRCFLISTGMLAISYIIFEKLKYPMEMYLLITIFFWGYIMIQAPIENTNKSLGLEENKVYRKRTRCILILEGLLFGLALYFDWKMLMRVITMAFFIVGISLIAGKKNCNLQRNKFNG